MAETRKFPHHLIREIFEQPDALRRTIEPRVSLAEGLVRLDEIHISREELRALRRINIVASGTSRHAGMTGQYMMQELAGVPVDVDYASEFEYRNPMIAREADGFIYTHAGPEISIASTKAFTAQMACLFLFALYLGEIKEKVSKALAQRYIGELLALSQKTETILAASDQVEKLAELYYRVDDFMFLGRAIHYPIAMDGALKLKEVSYIHAEGYPAGEAKHGPNALIDFRLPLVMIATCDLDDEGSVVRYEKNVSNMEGFKKQGATLIALATEGDTTVPQLANHTIFIPAAPELLSPILEIVPLQLFAYYVAAKRGLDVDRPRNLVKAVILE